MTTSADVLAQLAPHGRTEEATELREEVLARLLALNAERSAKASGSGASGAQRGRPPTVLKVSETVGSKVEPMGLG